MPPCRVRNSLTPFLDHFLLGLPVRPRSDVSRSSGESPVPLLQGPSTIHRSVYRTDSESSVGTPTTNVYPSLCSLPIPRGVWGGTKRESGQPLGSETSRNGGRFLEVHSFRPRAYRPEDHRRPLSNNPLTQPTILIFYRPDLQGIRGPFGKNKYKWGRGVNYPNFLFSINFHSGTPLRLVPPSPTRNPSEGWGDGRDGRGPPKTV